MTWHIPTATMPDYLSGDIGDADVWSIEAHLMNCARCRDRLTATAGAPSVAPEVAGVVARTRDAVAAATLEQPPPRRMRPGSRFRQYFMLSRSASASGLAWVAAAVLLVVVAVVLEAYTASSGVERDPWPWLAIVGPVIPVAGVAATYAPALDDASEIVAATPMSGLRLLLWRTLAILAVIVPLSVVASVFTVFTTSAAWLVPAIVLTAVTLAVTSMVGPIVASASVGLGWLVVVGGVGLGDHGAAAVHDLVTTSSSTLTWLAGGGIAAGVVYLRRAAYGSPSSSLPTTSEEPW